MRLFVYLTALFIGASILSISAYANSTCAELLENKSKVLSQSNIRRKLRHISKEIKAEYPNSDKAGYIKIKVSGERPTLREVLHEVFGEKKYWRQEMGAPAQVVMEEILSFGSGGRLGLGYLLNDSPELAEIHANLRVALITGEIKNVFWYSRAVVVAAGMDDLVVIETDDGKFWYMTIDIKLVASDIL